MLAAEVEVVEPVGASLLAGGDRVELVLHRGGEVVVDQPAEMLLQQPDHGERHPRRHQRAALLVHVAAVLDGLDDRRVRRRPADAQILERLDQRRLGVARRAGWWRGRRRSAPSASTRWPLVRCGSRLSASSASPPAWSSTRLHVGLQEAREGDRAAAGARTPHSLAASPRCRRSAATAWCRGRRPSARRPCAARSARRAGTRRCRARGALRRGAEHRHRRAGSPRGPPGRSSPCGCTAAASGATYSSPYSWRAWLRAASIADCDSVVESVRI